MTQTIAAYEPILIKETTNSLVPKLLREGKSPHPLQELVTIYNLLPNHSKVEASKVPCLVVFYSPAYQPRIQVEKMSGDSECKLTVGHCNELFPIQHLNGE